MKDPQPNTTPAPRKWLKGFFIGLAVAFICGTGYVWTHPLVFNESFWQHAHCMKQAGLALTMYAHDNSGKFPAHTNGYGDALRLVNAEGLAGWSVLTGPGYNGAEFERRFSRLPDVPESECGRVYIQGLTKSNDAELALLFDKIPTPGGDHSHLLRRLWAPTGREIWTVGDGLGFISETKWPEFCHRQIELLVKAGFTKQAAETLFTNNGKVD